MRKEIASFAFACFMAAVGVVIGMKTNERLHEDAQQLLAQAKEKGYLKETKCKECPCYKE